ncbi:helix-turn-helix domain-containing protein [Streptomyces sp. NPDC050548]|uniref:helix-turn-helix domain-containing protein n=1 Tax=Streptomyces sp. NPDC050548 TaxID=3365629 RepID=UPI0037AB622A
MNQEEAQALGERVKELRQRYEYPSVRALAKVTGLSHSYLAKLERGEIESPSTQTLERIAKVFSGNVQEILGKSSVKLSGELPDMRTYFRRTLGVSFDEADKLAALIEGEISTRAKKGGEHEEDEHKDDADAD